MTQCSALNNALQSKGLTHEQLAAKTSLSTQRINDILNGADKPTQEEFNAIAVVLGITGSYQHVLQAK